MARTGTAYLIEIVRQLTGAGTAEFTIDSTSYYTDDQIETYLDRHRYRLARQEVSFEHELSDGGGTVVYKNGRVGFNWLEDTNAGTAGFILSDSQGSIIGTANWTLSPEDGFLSFGADQSGSARYVTGWVHFPYRAAVDMLTAWLSKISMQTDWETDNMKMKSSQKAEAIRKQLEWLKSVGGVGYPINISHLRRDDIVNRDAE